MCAYVWWWWQRFNSGCICSIAHTIRSHVYYYVHVYGARFRHVAIVDATLLLLLHLYNFCHMHNAPPASYIFVFALSHSFNRIDRISMYSSNWYNILCCSPSDILMCQRRVRKKTTHTFGVMVSYMCKSFSIVQKCTTLSLLLSPFHLSKYTNTHSQIRAYGKT